jgi:hypothetical protein
MADEADVGRSGGLDNPANTLKDMPPELRGARKHRIGRHRIFYTGHHNECSYHTFYIKINKKAGVNDEADPKFHAILKTELATLATCELGPPEGSTRRSIAEEAVKTRRPAGNPLPRRPFCLQILRPAQSQRLISIYA